MSYFRAISLAACFISERLEFSASSWLIIFWCRGCWGVRTNLGWLQTLCKYRNACKWSVQKSIENYFRTRTRFENKTRGKKTRNAPKMCNYPLFLELYSYFAVNIKNLDPFEVTFQIRNTLWQYPTNLPITISEMFHKKFIFDFKKFSHQKCEWIWLVYYGFLYKDDINFI